MVFKRRGSWAVRTLGYLIERPSKPISHQAYSSKRQKPEQKCTSLLYSVMDDGISLNKSWLADVTDDEPTMLITFWHIEKRQSWGN